MNNLCNPDILYYAKLVDVTGDKSTPRYEIETSKGTYPPMEALRGRNGAISFYLLPSKDSGSSDNAPTMRLQGKNSFNLTGLKDYFVGGRMSGYAYGYPPTMQTYGAKTKRANPFLQNKYDAFLFIVHGSADKNNLRPSVIEMIVLRGGRTLATSYVKQLRDGGFDNELQQLRA